MEDLLEVCCGLDVHKENIVACLLKGPIDDDKPQKTIKTFSALSSGFKVPVYTGSLCITSWKMPLMVL